MTPDETRPGGPPMVEVAGQLYPAFLPTSQAAAWLHTCEDTLRSWRGTDRLPVEPVRMGAYLRWPTIAIARAAGFEPREVAPPLPEGDGPDVVSLAPGSQPDAA